MIFQLFKKNKLKILFWGTGFLVIAAITGTTLWIYFNFLTSHDDFFDITPAETVIFWHQDGNREIGENWIYDISRKMLFGEAAGQAQFLFDAVASKSSETAFAILPGFEDFIFFARIGASEHNALKEKLEEMNFSYIIEDSGKIIIANTKFSLKEVLSTMSQKNFSLADQKGRLIAWNLAGNNSSNRVYLGGALTWNNFYFPFPESDFWESNYLKIWKNGVDYSYFLITENEALGRETPFLLKNNLSILLPETRERKLPDGEVVKEIVADRDRFIFEKISIAGRNVDFLEVPEIKKEFFLFFVGEKVILSTSKDFLASFLVRLSHRPTYYGKNIVELVLSGARRLTNNFNGIIIKVDFNNQE